MKKSKRKRDPIVSLGSLILMILVDVIGIFIIIEESIRTNLKPFGILYALVILITSFCIAGTVMTILWYRFTGQLKKKDNEA